MAKKSSKPAERRPRTDAQRNRERILGVAKEAFTRCGANASLDEIAQEAGVGAGNPISPLSEPRCLDRGGLSN
jgi:AcrR family transcriptional regulator